ncbi:MAG: META domain-containing protein [Actinomycetota bacterium]|nr:META domain-containing protein [Actinomycetota bacterium]
MRRLALLMAVALGLTACLGNDFGDSLQGSWELESGTYDGEPIPMVDSHPITVTFDGDEIFGTAACNGYGGKWQINNGTFQILEMAWTEMACGPPAVMDSEAAYLVAISNVETIEPSDGKLIMTGSRTEMTFTQLDPVPTAEMLGTVWVLDGLVDGEGVSSVSGERATLELFSDGSFIGSTGCRTIAGSYVDTGVDIQFTSFAAEGDCPSDLTEQDSRVISALEGGFRVEIDGDRMTTWVAGDEGLAYSAEQ